MSQNKQLAETTTADAESSFSLKNFLKACGAKWKWFLISILFFTCAGVYYAYRTPPRYKRSMQVLIKDQDGGGGVGDIASSFSSLGLVSTNTNVYNELISLMSPAVMAEVVQRLNLDVEYTERALPYNKTLYGTNLPFNIVIPDLPANEAGSFRMDLNPDGSARLYKFVKLVPGQKIKFDKEVKMPAGATAVKTPIGTLQITPNQRYAGPGITEPVTINIVRSSFLPTVEKYTTKLKGDLVDKDADVLDLNIEDTSVERADDILNTVLDVYTSKWISDKNRISTATSQFIDDRLAVIEKELGSVDSDIMKYKAQTLVPDLEEAAKLNMKTTHDLQQEMLTASTQLSMARYVYDYVQNPANKNNVIPVNTGGVSLPIESQISTYNTTLLTRNNLAATSSATNPIVKDYDTQLAGMREAIERALKTNVIGYENQLKSLQRAEGGIKGQLASAPNQAKYLLSVERQQKVKEQLYLYLLQKREENELTQTFTADNTRVITPPYGPLKPVAPKKLLLISIAFLIGLGLPAGLVYVIESSNTTVRSRRDLDRMATPFMGEIPLGGRRKRFAKLRGLFKSKTTKELETLPARVTAGSRDVINESFRIVRGNIDFMNHGSGSSVLMVTSFNPGSGKSFVTYNLGCSFAIKGKKVLIIDCDLRHGSSSQFVGMPPKGISAYLTGNTSDWKHLVVADQEEPNLFVLPIGHRPPNPAELLETSNMKTLIEEARKEYDYIILDCPPVDIVVDTQVLAPLADRTIFIVRAGLLEKKSIKDIDELYKSYRFKQMSVLLNGTEKAHSRYGADGYGYYHSAYAVQE
ncbi:MAG: polysaccharide biosynthesis tyrosine autokinase [Muribaculaceae bacterium]|nr:polysaccharide biosynthesis tyrosine autokinase [Muribaculaceae bacterium]